MDKWKASMENQKKEREQREEAFKAYIESDEGKKKIDFSQQEIYKVMVPIVVIILLLQFCTGASNA